MSENQVGQDWIELHNEIFPGEWWWLSVIFHGFWNRFPDRPEHAAEWPSPVALDYHQRGNSWEATARAGREPTAARLGTITLTGQGTETNVRVIGPPETADYWGRILGEMLLAARAAQTRRRRALGARFEEILDDYYASKERGESPNLREMARAAGVKEGSLRQAKIRYDQQRRARSVSDD